MKRKHYLLSVEKDGAVFYAQRNPDCLKGYRLVRDKAKAESFGLEIMRHWLKVYPSGKAEEVGAPVRPDRPAKAPRAPRAPRAEKPAKATPPKKLSRKDALGLITAAGYEGDRARATRLLIENRIAKAAADEAFRRGAAKRARETVGYTYNASARKKAGRLVGIDPQELVAWTMVVAGTPQADEYLHGEFEPTCDNCGRPIKNVFVTASGYKLGGDCLATLTGDESTRQWMIGAAMKSAGAERIQFDAGSGRIIAWISGGKKTYLFDDPSFARLVPSLRKQRAEQYCKKAEALAEALGVPVTGCVSKAAADEASRQGVAKKARQAEREKTARELDDAIRVERLEHLGRQYSIGKHPGDSFIGWRIYTSKSGHVGDYKSSGSFVNKSKADEGAKKMIAKMEAELDALLENGHQAEREKMAREVDEAIRMSREEERWLERKPFLLLDDDEKAPEGYRIVEQIGPHLFGMSTDQLINRYVDFSRKLPIKTPYPEESKRRRFLDEEASRIGQSIGQGISTRKGAPAVKFPTMVAYFRLDPVLQAQQIEEKDRKYQLRNRFSEELNSAPPETTVVVSSRGETPDQAFRKTGTGKFSWRPLLPTGRGFTVEQWGAFEYGKGPGVHKSILDYYENEPSRVQIILKTDPKAPAYRLQDEIGPGGVDLDPDLISLMRNYRRTAEEVRSAADDLNRLLPSKKKSFKAFGYRSPPPGLREYANKLAALDVLPPAPHEGTILLIEGPPGKGFKHRTQRTWIFDRGNWKILRRGSQGNFEPFEPDSDLARKVAKRELEEALSDSKPFIARGFDNYQFFGPGHPDRALYLDQSPDGLPTESTKKLLRSFLSGARKKDAPGGVIKGWRSPEFHHLVRAIQAGWLERASESNEEAKFTDKGREALA